MTSPLRISLSLALALCAQKLCAQLAPADDFFNGGAQFYISNNIPEALEKVELGLRTYPNDEKLKKLEELLKQKQQQQQQQQNQQQQDPQKQPPKNNQPNDAQDQSQKTSDQSKAERPQPKPKEGGKDQELPDTKNAEKKPANDKNAEKSDEKPPEDVPAQAMKAGEMKPEEAKRLLDSQKDGERLLQLKPQEKPRNSSRPVKDW
jgi:Ca-activated chloride channel family protein